LIFYCVSNEKINGQSWSQCEPRFQSRTGPVVNIVTDHSIACDDRIEKYLFATYTNPTRLIPPSPHTHTPNKSSNTWRKQSYMPTFTRGESKQKSGGERENETYIER
jgi:hypothetical protein